MGYLRRLPKFEFFRPDTVDEVRALMAGAAEGETMLLAGGTDAILQMRRRERTPRCVVGLKSVAELDFVREESDGSLAIGAMTSLHDLATAPVVRRSYGVIAEAAGQIGGRELRNVATIGGNVAGALPCADLPPSLIALGARLKLSSSGGDRWLPLEEFYPALSQTAAVPGELVTEIRVARPAPFTAGAYLKYHDRHSMDMTVVGASAVVTLDAPRGTIQDVRLTLANCAPTTFRARGAEAVLRGRRLGDGVLAQTAEVACREASPRSSWRASRDYRLQLIRTLTRRVIAAACEKASDATGAQA
ncbi:MAG: FAD binding domain-containing protein [Burkholderiales bacterium]|nr:FAD binding domain-containing protein [Burkholderiales bacterium]